MKVGDNVKKHIKVMIMNTESMKIRIGGDNDIDLETLTNTLSSTVTALKVIADKTVKEEQYCKFVVKNVEKGSFVVVIQEVQEIMTAISPLVAAVPTILTILKEAVELKKILGGEKPKSVEYIGNNVKVEAHDNSTVTINNYSYNVYTHDSQLEKSLSETMRAVEKDGRRTYLSYDFGDDGEVSIPQDMFKRLSVPIDVENLENNVQEKVSNYRTIVKVIKPDLHNKTKWDLVFSGEVVKADIEDEDFLNAVHQKYVEFTSMIDMDVDLEVCFRTDQDGVPLVNTKRTFRVVKVYSCGKYKQGDFKQPTLFDA